MAKKVRKLGLMSGVTVVTKPKAKKMVDKPSPVSRAMSKLKASAKKIVN